MSFTPAHTGTYRPWKMNFYQKEQSSVQLNGGVFRLGAKTCDEERGNRHEQFQMSLSVEVRCKLNCVIYSVMEKQCSR